VFKDVPPFVTAAGYDASPHGINSEGLKRRGFSAERIAAIKRAYKTLYRAGLTLEEAKAALTEQCKDAPDLNILLDFLTTSTRGIIR
jgi:UDP-N-acetylglucosamine acyltransferase